MSTPFEFLHSSVRISPGRRIIRAQEFDDYQTAQGIIQQAEAKAEAIVKDAQKIYDDRRLEGYKQGIIQANDEKAAFCLQVTNEFADSVKSLENRLSEVLPRVVRNFIGDIGEEEAFVRYVTQAVNDFIDDEKISIKVHPTRRHLVEDSLTKLLESKENDLGRLIRITSDPTLDEDQATIETKTSIVVLDLSEQIDRLEHIFGDLVRKTQQETSMHSASVDEMNTHQEIVSDQPDNNSENDSDSHLADDLAELELFNSIND